jgi:hypothetical protein
MIFLDKDTENKWKCRIFVFHIMSETQEIKDGLTVLEETEGREDATYDHIVKYTGFLGGIQVLTILVSVVRNKLAAVLLSTAGVGLSALYQSVIGFLHNTSNLGISFSSIKEIAEYYGENHPEKVLLQVEVERMDRFGRHVTVPAVFACHKLLGFWRYVPYPASLFAFSRHGFYGCYGG